MSSSFIAISFSIRITELERALLRINRRLSLDKLFSNLSIDLANWVGVLLFVAIKLALMIESTSE